MIFDLLVKTYIYFGIKGQELNCDSVGYLFLFPTIVRKRKNTGNNRMKFFQGSKCFRLKLLELLLRCVVFRCNNTEDKELNSYP